MTERPWRQLPQIKEERKNVIAHSIDILSFLFIYIDTNKVFFS
jgi:hypothetical protein